MSNIARFEHRLRTEKQKAFVSDFLANWERNEFWDSIEIGRTETSPETFVVREEDVLAYNLAMGETHPLLVDREHALEHAPYGTIVAHPIFVTTIFFWFSQPGEQVSWIRTPGARNPFQHIVTHHPIRVGDRLTCRHTNTDRYWRRGKAYITCHYALHDQNDLLKAEATVSLILPPTRDDVATFAQA